MLHIRTFNLQSTTAATDYCRLLAGRSEKLNSDYNYFIHRELAQMRKMLLDQEIASVKIRIVEVTDLLNHIDSGFANNGFRQPSIKVQVLQKQRQLLRKEKMQLRDQLKQMYECNCYLPSRPQRSSQHWCCLRSKC